MPTNTRQRTINIVARVTPEEDAEIRQSASAAGLSVSAFVRAAALRRRIVPLPSALLQGLGNLGRLGGLLKLAVVQIDQGKSSPALLAELDTTLAAVHAAADDLRNFIG